MSTTTTTETYTTVDVENVVRRFGADLKMIADSTGAITAEDVKKYVHDIELLAKKGYLRWVDVTLLNLGAEVSAVRYTVDTDAGSLTSSRPGGVLWPRVTFPDLRIVISYTPAYDAEAREAMSGRLSFSWSRSYDDTDHSSLTGSGGRDYTSNAYGMSRKDWSK